MFKRVGPKFLLLRLVCLSLALAACSTASTASTTSSLKGSSAKFTSYKLAGCSSNRLTGGIANQSMNGAINACVRVGNIKPGRYTVSLTGVQINKSFEAGANGTPSISEGSNLGPKVSISLSPSTGKPGTVVTVTGSVSMPFSRLPDNANLCWDGCIGGLSYSGVSLTWLSPTRFTASLTVPSAPWFLQNTNEVAKLRTGNYRISVQCLTSTKGCGLGSSEASAVFHLNGSNPKWCKTTSSCATLQATAKTYFPGDIVKVSGFAPLQSIIGSKDPFSPGLTLSPGASGGDAIEFKKINNGVKGGTSLLIGDAPIDVLAAPSFASLGKITPGQSVQAGPSPISANPANPGTVLWCSGDKIGLFGPNGNSLIDTTSAAGLLEGAGYGLLGSKTPRCGSVALADVGSVSQLIAVSFSVAPNDQAPPVANVAMATFDEGKTWEFVPVPAGSNRDSFAGFRYQGSSVQALFAPVITRGKFTSSDASSIPIVETLTSGGSSWSIGSFACPTEGPCVTFGSYIEGNCAMVGSPQQIFRSSDQGRKWSKPNWPTSVDGCWESQLVPISPHSELQINSGSQFYLLQSKDSGKSWNVVGLPTPPGASSTTPGLAGSSASLDLLPDGALLLTGTRETTNVWDLLAPRATKWCAIKGLPSGTQSSVKFSKTYVLGNEIYWIDQGQYNNSSALRSISIDRIKC